MDSARQPAAGLDQLAIFRQLAPGKLARLARRSRAVSVPRGATIARRGERLEGLVGVLQGLVKLTLRGDSEKVLRLVGPGETFGESSVLLGQPMPADAIALADSSLAIVPCAPLLALVDSDRAFARELLGSVSRRLHALIADFEATTQHGARERLAAYLESLAPPGGEPASVRLPATKTVIAARLGVTKETLSRLLHQLAEEDLIAVERSDITLLDRRRLVGAQK
jgi:CRP-like cAMP-binding protein